jgi:hypothetical protein
MGHGRKSIIIQPNTSLIPGLADGLMAKMDGQADSWRNEKHTNRRKDQQTADKLTYLQTDKQIAGQVD